MQNYLDLQILQREAKSVKIRHIPRVLPGSRHLMRFSACGLFLLYGAEIL